MSAELNSILNLIAQLIMFAGGFIIYIRFLFKEYVNWYIYQITRFGLALLLTFSLARVLFDLNVVITGVNKTFNLLESVIALGRNYGFGIVLFYCIYLIYVLVKMVQALKGEIKLLNKQIEKLSTTHK